MLIFMSRHLKRTVLLVAAIGFVCYLYATQRAQQSVRRDDLTAAKQAQLDTLSLQDRMQEVLAAREWLAQNSLRLGYSPLRGDPYFPNRLFAAPTTTPGARQRVSGTWGNLAYKIDDDIGGFQGGSDAAGSSRRGDDPRRGGVFFSPDGSAEGDLSSRIHRESDVFSAKTALNKLVPGKAVPANSRLPADSIPRYPGNEQLPVWRAASGVRENPDVHHVAPMWSDWQREGAPGPQSENQMSVNREPNPGTMQRQNRDVKPNSFQFPGAGYGWGPAASNSQYRALGPAASSAELRPGQQHNHNPSQGLAQGNVFPQQRQADKAINLAPAPSPTHPSHGSKAEGKNNAKASEESDKTGKSALQDKASHDGKSGKIKKDDPRHDVKGHDVTTQVPASPDISVGMVGRLLARLMNTDADDVDRLPAVTVRLPPNHDRQQMIRDRPTAINDMASLAVSHGGSESDPSRLGRAQSPGTANESFGNKNPSDRTKEIDFGDAFLAQDNAGKPSSVHVQHYGYPQDKDGLGKASVSTPVEPSIAQLRLSSLSQETRGGAQGFVVAPGENGSPPQRPQHVFPHGEGPQNLQPGAEGMLRSTKGVPLGPNSLLQGSNEFQQRSNRFPQGYNDFPPAAPKAVSSNNAFEAKANQRIDSVAKMNQLPASDERDSMAFLSHSGQQSQRYNTQQQQQLQQQQLMLLRKQLQERGQNDDNQQQQVQQQQQQQQQQLMLLRKQLQERGQSDDNQQQQEVQQQQNWLQQQQQLKGRSAVVAVADKQQQQQRNDLAVPDHPDTTPLHQGIFSWGQSLLNMINPMASRSEQGADSHDALSPEFERSVDSQQDQLDSLADEKNAPPPPPPQVAGSFNPAAQTLRRSFLNDRNAPLLQGDGSFHPAPDAWNLPDGKHVPRDSHDAQEEQSWSKKGQDGRVDGKDAAAKTPPPPPPPPPIATALPSLEGAVMITRDNKHWKVDPCENTEVRRPAVTLNTPLGQVPLYIATPNDTRTSIPDSRSYNQEFGLRWNTRGIRTMFERCLLPDPNTTLIDIGSGVGAVALTAAVAGHAVLAVEPLDWRAQTLCSTVTDFGYRDLHVIHNAASDDRGMVYYRALSSQPHDKDKYVVDLRNKSKVDANSAAAFAIKLDDVLRVFKVTTAVIRMEAGGLEGRVLSGAHKILNTLDIPCVLMEWTYTHDVKDFGGSYIFDVMSRFGFFPHDVNTLKPLKVFRMHDWPEDVLWAKIGSPPVRL